MRRKIEHYINLLKKNNGYIAIETIIISGMILGLGALTLGGFGDNSSSLVNVSNNTITHTNNLFNSLK